MKWAEMRIHAEYVDEFEKTETTRVSVSMSEMKQLSFPFDGNGIGNYLNIIPAANAPSESSIGSYACH